MQQLIYTCDTLYTSLQAQASYSSKLWFTSLTAGAVVGIDKIIMLIALIVFRMERI